MEPDVSSPCSYDHAAGLCLEPVCEPCIIGRYQCFPSSDFPEDGVIPFLLSVANDLPICTTAHSMKSNLHYQSSEKLNYTN
jgi:hypothetical protein